MNRIRSLLPRGRFARSVVVLAGGTTLGQAIAVLASPVLTRLYSPGDFGILAVYVSILSIAATVTSLRYELAIPLSKDDDTAASLVVLSLTIVLGMSVLIGLGIWFLGEWIVTLVNIPALRPYLWLLPLGLVGIGVYQILNYWAVRRNAFLDIARTKLSQGIGMVLTQVGLGLVKLGPLGLMLGQVVGWSAGSGRLALLAFRDQHGRHLRQVNLAGVHQAARRYWRLACLGSLSDFADSAGLHASSLLWVALYGPEVGGLYALAQRIVGIPMALIGRAISQVYFGTAAELARGKNPELRRLFLTTASRLLFIGGPPILLLGLGGPRLFGIVFGSAWQNAGAFTRALIPMFVAQIVMSPLSPTLYILEKQGTYFMWTVMRLLLVVGAIGGSHAANLQAEHAMAVFGVTMLLAYSTLFLLSLSNLSSATTKEGTTGRDQD